MEKTVVQCECVAKKQSKNWDAKNPLQHQIELQVPYDKSSIYYQMSGGTNFTLNTINQAAADMFEIGEKYEITISPVEVAE